MIIPPENLLAPPTYRFRRGAKLVEMPPVPPQLPVPPLSALDGPFQLAEYLSLKVRHDPHDIKGLVDVPSDNAKAADRHVWIYEHLRRIPIDATPLITQLVQLCSRETCPEMKADEWLYLCVAHGGEGTDRCCAIDYILHTLDSTSALLNSPNYFPSRLHIPNASLAHFPSLFRRLSRIFSHAYFHHREAFATSEAETSLYARFVALCQKYDLVGANLLIIPAEGYEMFAEHDEDEADEATNEHDEEEKPDDDSDEEQSSGGNDHGDDDDGPRGRDKEGGGELAGRSHSLGRHPAPYQSPGKWVASPVQVANKGKPAPAQASETHSPPSTRAALDNLPETTSPTPTTPTTTASPSSMLTGKQPGRGTLSRGKAPRGSTTSMWSASPSRSPPTDSALTPDDPPAAEIPIGMARRESVESAIYVGDEDEPRTTSPLKEAFKERPTEPMASTSPPTAGDIPKAQDEAAPSLPPLPETTPCPPALQPEDPSEAPTSPSKVESPADPLAEPASSPEKDRPVSEPPSSFPSTEPGLAPRPTYADLSVSPKSQLLPLASQREADAKTPVPADDTPDAGLDVSLATDAETAAAYADEAEAATDATDATKSDEPTLAASPPIPSVLVPATDVPASTPAASTEPAATPAAAAPPATATPAPVTSTTSALPIPLPPKSELLASPKSPQSPGKRGKGRGAKPRSPAKVGRKKSDEQRGEE